MSRTRGTRKRIRLVCGVGINDAPYKVLVRLENGKTWQCPFYTKWKSMLTRCYGKLYKSENPSYLDCMVFKDWLLFSNFRSWMESQDWRGKDLDKDILIKGNGLYSPETCVFVSHSLNSFIADFKSGKKYLKGVGFHKDVGKFTARIADGNSSVSGSVTLGYFKTQEEAHLCYCKKKLELAYKIIEEEAPEQRVADALIKRYTDQLTEAEKLLNKIS